MSFDHLGERVKRLADSASSYLTRTDVESITELVAHGEPGVAFEMLCNQLYERDWPVSAAEYRELAALGEEMHLRPSALALWARELERPA